MRRQILTSFVLLLLLTMHAVPGGAQAPEYVSYQGTLFTGGVGHTGPAEFKFVIFDDAGNTAWSNDGTSTTGNEPTASVTVLVQDGVFSVLLGHPDLAMVPLFPEFLHNAPFPQLRVWVDTGGGFEQLDDVALASTPYALESLVARRAIGTFLVDGEVHTLGGIRFPDDTVQMTAATGSGSDSDWVVSGDDMYSGVNGNVGIGTTTPQRELDVYGGVGAYRYILNGSGGKMIEMWEDGFNSGSIDLGGSGGSELDRGLSLRGAGVGGGGQIILNNAAGSATVQIEGQWTNGGGSLMLSNGTYATGLLHGYGTNGGGELQLANNNNTLTYFVRGHAYGSGSQLTMRDVNGVAAQQITAHNREMKFFNSAGTEQVYLSGADSGGELLLKQNDNQYGVRLDGDSSGHGDIRVYDDAGAASVQIVGEDSGGNGRVITDVLEITGGADLSEQFDISAEGEGVQPGMTVCIDPQATGRLAISRAAYDRKVAGIVSGAGGVRPGMLMGQDGSLADGAHPVALTGRVWTWCDASASPIEPGDRLTTSSRPGHAMKATDATRASGATLGKAMSSLENGQGLVLVLVNLQ